MEIKTKQKIWSRLESPFFRWLWTPEPERILVNRSREPELPFQGGSGQILKEKKSLILLMKMKSVQFKDKYRYDPKKILITLFFMLKDEFVSSPKV